MKPCRRRGVNLTQVGNPMTSDQLVGGFAALSDELGLADSMSAASVALARFAVAHLGADVAWVSLQHGNGTLTRPSGADPMFRLLDLVGHGLDRPEAVALPSRIMITVDDTRSDGRWPDWAASAAGAGVRSVRRVGLTALHEASPSFDLYALRPRAFGNADSTLQAAGHASVALLLLDRLAILPDAMQSRAVIAQAQGMLMERHGLSADRAMSYLRRRSQEAQVKVRDLAGDLTEELQREAPVRGIFAQEKATRAS